MADTKIRIRIISPKGVIYQGETPHAVFPGVMGSFAVYPQHAPIISALAAGKIRYYAGQQERTIDITSGFIEVKDDVVTVCVEGTGEVAESDQTVH